MYASGVPSVSMAANVVLLLVVFCAYVSWWSGSALFLVKKHTFSAFFFGTPVKQSTMASVFVTRADFPSCSRRLLAHLAGYGIQADTINDQAGYRWSSLVIASSSSTSLQPFCEHATAFSLTWGTVCLQVPVSPIQQNEATGMLYKGL
jgi:hypothetical protein